MNKKEKNWSDKMIALDRENSLKNRAHELETRALSVTVGTCFGGVTEISMRGSLGKYMWSPLQPVEVIELINQLSASIGCHIHIKPRRDFASWRQWREEITTPNYKLLDSADFWDLGAHKVGTALPLPKEQPGLTKEKIIEPSKRNKSKKTKESKEIE